MRLPRWELAGWVLILAAGAFASLRDPNGRARGAAGSYLAIRELTKDSTIRASHEAILVFMRPQDCPDALDLLDRAAILGSAGAVPVLGVIVVDTVQMPDWRSLVSANRIPFRTVAISPPRARALLSRFSPSRTPVALRYSRSNRGLQQVTLAR